VNIYRVLFLFTHTHNTSSYNVTTVSVQDIYRIMSQTRKVCSQQDRIRVTFHAGHLVLGMSEKARRVVDDVRVVAV